MASVLMVAAENDALPRGKVGGIGDVIRDVPIELVKQNAQVDVITPSYGFQSTKQNASKVYSFDVPFKGGIEKVELFSIDVPNAQGVNHWVLEHKLFAVGGIGAIYCDDGAERPFASDATKFALFSTAVSELLVTHWLDKFTVVHLHDWHAAFIVILRAFHQGYQKLKSLRCVYTIHNLALQGIRPFSGDESAFDTWFPSLNYNTAMIADPRYQNCLNPTRAGINLSDAVHVVSKTYAKEIVKKSDHSIGFIGGEGLENDLQKAAAEKRLFGILNGCQYDVSFDNKVTLADLYQQIDIDLARWISLQPVVKSAHFLADKRLAKWQSKKSAGPLLTSVGRLTDQKMALLLLPYKQHLVLDELLEQLLLSDGRLIILGSGDAKLEQKMTQLMATHSNLLFLNGYCDLIPNMLYQLGDMFLMPSLFEPCGISQMLAMRAGQPCIVHKIGGLNDTVEHLKTGFSFSGNDNIALASGVVETTKQAITLFTEDKKAWRKIKAAAHKQRFEWQDSIKQYLTDLYKA